MNIQKKTIGFLILSILSIVILFGCGSQDVSNKEVTEEGKKAVTSEKVIELNVNNWAPSTHHIAYNVLEPWKDFVEEKTDGRIEVNLYHGATLGKITSVYQDIKGGLYELSLLGVTYYDDTNFFPYTIGHLPFAFEGSEAASKILKKFGEKYVNDEINDVVLLDPVASDPYNLFSTKPVKSIEDLKNKKMRINGKSEADLVKAIGGVPVSLSTDEIYEGLQKNTVDTAFYSPIGGHGLKLYEPAPYLTIMDVTITLLIPVFNKDFYEELPDDLKVIFEEELNPKLNELYKETYTKELEKSYKKLEEDNKKGEIIKLSDEELEPFREAGKAAWEEWIKTANEKDYPGQEMVDDLLMLLEEEGYPAPY